MQNNTNSKGARAQTMIEALALTNRHNPLLPSFWESIRLGDFSKLSSPYNIPIRVYGLFMYDAGTYTKTLMYIY